MLASVVENAQPAALEITDGVDIGRVSELVDSMQSSVERSAQLLQLLLRQSSTARS